MKSARVLAASLIALALLWGGLVFGQTKPNCEQIKASAPAKIDGQVVKIDNAGGRLSVREADGKVREFQVSQETLKDLKVGDRIEAKLSSIPNC